MSDVGLFGVGTVHCGVDVVVAVPAPWWRLVDIGEETRTRLYFVPVDHDRVHDPVKRKTVKPRPLTNKQRVMFVRAHWELCLTPGQGWVWRWGDLGG